jgi:hypothetical protein
MNEEEKQFHKKTAVKTFNEAWDYLDKGERTPDDIRRMMHLAHASLYHWGIVGTPRNLAVGNWQLSRAYCAIGEPKLGLVFARVSLRVCEGENLGDILHTAYEGMARALALSGEKEDAREYLLRAKKHLDSLSLDDKEDQEIFSSQIADTEALLR